MNLSKAQEDLIKEVGSNPEVGLTVDQASARREQDGFFNVVDPPVKCPQWVCCLLPCIKHIPTMKAFKLIKPDDAEVLRDGKWIRYDATSLVRGDIIRLEEGDIVPADCTILTVMDNTELLVDLRSITGDAKPQSANSRDCASSLIQLYWGGHVVQGTCLAVVTAIGPKTLVASLIRGKRFPPPVRTNTSEYDDVENNPNAEDGIALIGQSA